LAVRRHFRERSYAARKPGPGTSYLSSLTIGSAAAVAAPAGKTVTMTVNGTPTAITPGNTYSGNIKLTVS